MKCYVQLGKAGDIVSILPCLKADHDEGNTPSILVSKKYAHVVAPLDYCKPEIWSGDMDDLAGAIAYAKSRFSNVALPQMFGRQYIPKRSFPSFQYDQWDRCGRLSQWGLSLSYPAGKSPRTKQGRYILIGDKSESSPFSAIDELVSALELDFSHEIVRLSDIGALELPDLVALYRDADLIFTVDTLHLHLSGAVRTPVIALAADSPSRWQGSAYHPRMALHIRYLDFEAKLPNIIHVSKACVDKKELPKVEAVKTANEYGYNLSLLRVGDKLLKTYRWHPEKSWRTELSLMVGDSETKIKPPQKYELHSIEDGRLFQWKNQVHISCTIARSKTEGLNFDPCIQGYGRLLETGEIVDWVEPQYGKNDWKHNEKNWLFFESGGRLFFSYSTSPDHVVCELENGKVVREYRSPVPPCWYGSPRGGTQPLPYHGGLLRFFHANLPNKKSDHWWNYSLGAMLMEATPPFRITKISSMPILTGNEAFYRSKFWKPKVVIPYGAVERDGGWDVGVGMNDAACGIAHIKPEHLNL